MPLSRCWTGPDRCSRQAPRRAALRGGNLRPDDGLDSVAGFAGGSVAVALDSQAASPCSDRRRRKWSPAAWRCRPINVSRLPSRKRPLGPAQQGWQAPRRFVESAAPAESARSQVVPRAATSQSKGRYLQRPHGGRRPGRDEDLHLKDMSPEVGHETDQSVRSDDVRSSGEADCPRTALHFRV